MKKIFTFLFATAVAAIAMVSCQKTIQEEIGNETSESSIHFYAEKIQTKTEFGSLSAGEYPTLWTDSKGIKISYNKKSSVEATVTPKDSYTKADFTPASAFSDDGSSSHVFYAMSPSTAQLANISTSYYSWRFNVPSTQTPLAGSVDEDAQIIYAKHDAGATFPTSVGFSFNHVTAYGKLSFSNLTLDADEDVSSITLTASKDWVGQWFYYVATKDTNSEGDFKARDGYVSKKITLNTDQTADIWFACAPVDLSDGGTIDINIFTNKGVYSKKVTFPSGKGNFTAGRVGKFTVSMSGVVRSAVVNNIAAIKALYTSSDVPFVANLTDALVTIVSGNNFYMQDATGGILGFTAGHGLAIGDKLNGTISGTVTKYQGNFEITGFDNSATKTTGNAVTPETVAHSTLVDDFDDYESEYVKVEGLTVSAVSGKDITVSENASLKVRNETGNDITVGSQINAVGVACYYNETKQVKIFSLAEEDKLVIGSVITASNKSVSVGGTVSIGATTNSPATITYASDDETVATVNASGVITGVKAGTATITCSVAASGKYTAVNKDITVTVSGTPPTVIEYDFNDASKYSDASFPTGGTQTASELDLTIGGNSCVLTAPTNYYRINNTNDATRALFFGKTSSSSVAAYLEFPGIAGKKITKITVTTSSSGGASIAINIFDTSGNAKSSAQTTASSTEHVFDFDITSPAVNTPYRVSSKTNNKNLQIKKVVVTYN